MDASGGYASSHRPLAPHIAYASLCVSTPIELHACLAFHCEAGSGLLSPPGELIMAVAGAVIVAVTAYKYDK